MLLYCEPCELMLCMLSEITNLGLLSENQNKDDQQRTLSNFTYLCELEDFLSLLLSTEDYGWVAVIKSFKKAI